jgi:putative DNA primase/helicase
MLMTYEEVVSRFPNPKPCAGGAMVQCSAHDDKQGSVKISRGDDRVLIRCHAGCDTADVLSAKGLSMSDLFFTPRNGTSNGNGNHSSNGNSKSLTLAQFAAAKGFDSQFLTRSGVVEEKGALVFHYLLLNGQRAARQRIRLALSGDRKFIWNKAEGKPVPFGLWRLPEARKRGIGDLFMVEGESDSLTLWLHGHDAIGIPGADNCKLLQAPHVAGFKRVLIVRENDHGGEVFEKGCTGRLAELEYHGQVAVIEMAKADVKDVNDLHVKLLGDAGGFDSEWQALIEQVRAVDLPIVGLEVFDASMVKERRVEWLWRGRIPLGKLVLYVGHPGLGKSFAALDVVARLTNGAVWPDGTPNGLIAKSLIFSAEDSIEDTIPRLIELGATRGNAMLVRRMREANEAGEITRRSFNLGRDLPQLERALDRHPETRLVVIDPVSAYMGRVDSHKNAEVRSDILDPLAELAERRNVTVLAVTHFNKGSAGNSLERISGSVAFPAAARVVWGFARDPEDPIRRLMLFGKSNVGPEMPGLAFRIVGTENGRATIEWMAGEVAANLNEVLSREAEQQREASTGRKSEAAVELLREMLANGARLNSDIEAAAEAAGISERTLRRAKLQLGVTQHRAGFAGGFKVALPSKAS